MKKYTERIDCEDLWSLCLENRYCSEDDLDIRDRLYKAISENASAEVLAGIIWSVKAESNLDEITKKVQNLALWEVSIYGIADALQNAGYRDTDIALLSEVIRTHPDAGKAYRVTD